MRIKDDLEIQSDGKALPLPTPPKHSHFSNQKIAFQKLKPKPCSTPLYLNRAVSATQGHFGGGRNDPPC